MFKNIPIIKFYIIFLSIIYSNIQCSNRIRYATRKDKLVLQNNCYACHAPTVKVEGIAQNQMLPKFGYKGLEKYLQNNFKYKTDCQVVEHCPIKLTNKEIASILIFLKEYR